MQKRTFLQLLAAHGALTSAGRAFGQAEYPSRQIEFVIPLPPGGPTDGAPRIALQYMAPFLRVPLVPVNKPGAGGGIAAAAQRRINVSHVILQHRHAFLRLHFPR